MRSRHLEITCDYCNQSEHYKLGSWDDTALRADGWIITNDKKHFCTEDCRYMYRKEHNTNNSGGG